MEVNRLLQAPAALHAVEKVPDTHWMGPRAGLDVVQKKEISCTCQEQNPGSPVRSPITISTELSKLQTHI
jgi:hypothetical protein